MEDPKPADETVEPAADPAAPQSEPDATAGDGIDVEVAKQNVVAALQTVYDPEIPVNIFELGMIYEVEVEPDGKAFVKMTLTSPSCPVAGSLPGEVETKVAGVPGITESKVDLVWDPPWNPGMMSEVARLQTGMMF